MAQEEEQKVHMLQDAKEDGGSIEGEGFSTEGCARGGECGAGGGGGSYASIRNTGY